MKVQFLTRRVSEGRGAGRPCVPARPTTHGGLSARPSLTLRAMITKGGDR